MASERERVLRIVDANRNRAVEALRVVEEHARFVREAPALARRLQALRREVAQAWAATPGLLAARDVLADPGHPDAAGATPPSGRSGVEDVVRANLSRAQEALRALEEWGKLVDAGAAAAVARVRYAVYALEADVVAPRPAFGERRVYVLLDDGPGRRPLEDQARAVLDGGGRVLQLRAKRLEGGARLQVARALAALCERAGALLIVNDRPDVARLAGAHGVHVGQDDLPADEARRIVGPGALVGASAHDAAELARVVAAGADHVGFGTLFASPTKPALGSQGLEALRALAATCPLPIFGIGGVTLASAPDVIRAGAFGVAVSSAVIDAPDPAAATAALVAAVAAAAKRVVAEDAP